MIIYDLCCANDHRFEGWFQSEGDFDRQVNRQLLICPQCDSNAVRRVPSAVAIGGQTDKRVGTLAQPRKEAAVMAPGGEIRAAYRQLVRAVMAHTEDVGDTFAEEARRIHYAEVPERAIRGTATHDDIAALADEGITVIALPKLSEDLN